MAKSTGTLVNSEMTLKDTRTSVSSTDKDCTNQAKSLEFCTKDDVVPTNRESNLARYFDSLKVGDV